MESWLQAANGAWERLLPIPRPSVVGCRIGPGYGAVSQRVFLASYMHG